MSEHPSDLIPGFVLGALDDDQTRAVELHLTACPTCRAEAESFRASLAGAGPGVRTGPRRRVKRRLMARIAGRERPPSGWRGSLLTAAGALVALLLAFASMPPDLRVWLGGPTARPTAAQEIAGGGLASLLTAPGTVSRELQPSAAAPSAHATAYMRIGDRRVGLRVSGLPDLPAGSVYQLWLAGPDGAVPGDTFTVGPGGATELIFVAPAFAERYTEMMVTVERAGGAETPSAEIVLDAKL